MQKLDWRKYDAFTKRNKHQAKALICYKCKHKSKKSLACGINCANELDFENNKCKKFESTGDNNEQSV